MSIYVIMLALVFDYVKALCTAFTLGAMDLKLLLTTV